MTSNYPGALDTWTDKQDDIDYPMAEYINSLHAAIINLETVLGINPQGPDSTVAERLDGLTWTP